MNELSRIGRSEFDRIDFCTTGKLNMLCLSVVPARELIQAISKKLLDSAVIYDIFFLCT